MNSISPGNRRIGCGLPLVLGIAEQSDLAEDEQASLQQSLSELLANLKRAYPHTPLLLLTPLAGEVDRAAAAIFQSQGSDVLVASLDANDEAGTASRDGKLRTCSSAADALTVHHCQILLAARSEKAGRWQLEGLPPELAPRRGTLDPPEIGPLVRLSVSSDQGDHNGGFTVSWPNSLKVNRKQPKLETIFRAFDRLNIDLEQLTPTLVKSAGDESSAAHFEAVDRLASYYQRRATRSLAVILGMAAVGALSLNLRIVLPDWARVLIWIYAVALGCAYAAYLRAKYGSFHNKYLDYRALAEGLRVQMFWNLGGVKACAADYYLQRQKGELAWIRQAVRNWFLIDTRRTSSVEVCSDAERSRLESVYRQWIKDQLAFFQQSATRRDRTSRWLGVTARTLFRIGLALAALNAVVAPYSAIVLLAGMAPVGAALIHLYSRHRALSEDARRYASMSQIWSVADHVFAERLAEGDLSGCRDVVRELGHETLAENGDWIVLHRQRPLEAPTIK